MDFLKKWTAAVTAVCLAVLLAAGCGQTPAPADAAPPAASAAQSTAQSAVQSAQPDEAPTSGPDASAVTEAEPPEEEAPEEDLLDPDGSYTSVEDVSLYLYTYGCLPGNFITKKEARALGWEGGSLEPYAPGMCIGGDYFGNYEGVLPADAEYHECDIDTLGAQKRGARRLVYSDDAIYYTEDHYESFTLLYGEG